MLLVNKHIPVPRLPSHHILHSLIRVGHGPRLNPGLDALVSRQLQHIADLAGRPDERAADLDVAADEGEGVDGRQAAAVGRTDLDEAAAGPEEAEVRGEGHLGARDGADDQIQRPRVLLRPPLVVVRGDVRVRAELQHLVALLRLARDAHDAVRAQRLREQDAEMPEPADAHDPHRLARPAAVLLQGVVDGDAAAEHRRRVLGFQAVGDLDNEAVVRALVVRVAAEGLTLVARVQRVIRADEVRAVVLAAGGALWAVGGQARADLGADADAVADLDVLDVGADADGGAYDLVADAAGFFLGRSC